MNMKKEKKLPQHVVNVRVNHEEYEMMRQWAFVERKPMATLIRMAIEDKTKDLKKLLTLAVNATTMSL